MFPFNTKDMAGSVWNKILLFLYALSKHVTVNK